MTTTIVKKKRPTTTQPNQIFEITRQRTRKNTNKSQRATDLFRDGKKKLQEKISLNTNSILGELRKEFGIGIVVFLGWDV